MDIIEAFVVELGLDASKFTEGQKEAQAGLAKILGAGEKTGDDMKRRHKETGESFVALGKRLLAMAGIYVSARGAINFFESLHAGIMQVSIYGRNLGISANELLKWQRVAELAGGSAQAMTQTIVGIQRELTNFSIGRPSNIAAVLNRFGVSMRDASGKMKSGTQIIRDLAKARKELGINPQSAAAYWAGFIDEATISMMISESDELERYLNLIEKFRNITPEDERIAREQTLMWSQLAHATEDAGNAFLEWVAPVIKSFLAVATKVVELGGKIMSLQLPGWIRELMKKYTYYGSEFVPPGGKSAAEKEEDFNREYLGEQGGQEQKGQGGASSAPQGGGSDGGGRPPAEKMSLQTPHPINPPGGETYKGAASYYTGLPSEGGSMTSTGERVDPNSYTGALQSDLAKRYGGLRKGGVWGDVIDEKTGKRVRVYFNDTGPLRPGRIMDLSPRAFKEFGPMRRGVHPNLRLEILPPAPPGHPYQGGPVDPTVGGAPTPATPRPPVNTQNASLEGWPQIEAFNTYRYARFPIGGRSAVTNNTSTSEVKVGDVKIETNPTDAYRTPTPFWKPGGAGELKRMAGLVDYGLA